MGSEACALSVNQDSTSLRMWWITLVITLLEVFALTFVSRFLCHHFRFFNITLIVIPSSSKMADGITYILFTAYLTAQQVNQTFIVAIKTMVYFINFFLSGESREFVSNICAFTKFTPWISIPLAPYISFIRLQLRSHYVIFFIPSTSVRKHQRRWENLLNFFITIYKKK